jgi:hypothetical protein
MSVIFIWSSSASARANVESTKNVPVIHARKTDHGSDLVRRRGADHDRNWHILSKLLVAFGINSRVVGVVAHINIGRIFRPIHEAINALIDKACIRIAADNIGIVQIGVPVPWMM